MNRFVRAAVALGITTGVLFLVAPPISAGGPGAFVLDVDGATRCLPSGQAEITWTAVLDLAGSTGTTIGTLPEIEPLGDVALGVRFAGEQSGAATGAVTFDPAEQTIIADPSSFPVDSQAVALASGTTGGTVGLDVLVRLFNTLNPDEEFVDIPGEGSVELPICEQPTVTEATTATSPAAETRPRFTG